MRIIGFSIVQEINNKIQLSLYQVTIIGIMLWRKRKENKELFLNLGKTNLIKTSSAYSSVDSDLIYLNHVPEIITEVKYLCNII